MELYGPWISGISGANKATLTSRRTSSLWSNVEVVQSCYGEGEILTVWMTSWILWRIKPFWQQWWFFRCRDWSLMI